MGYEMKMNGEVDDLQFDFNRTGSVSATAECEHSGTGMYGLVRCQNVYAPAWIARILPCVTGSQMKLLIAVLLLFGGAVVQSELGFGVFTSPAMYRFSPVI